MRHLYTTMPPDSANVVIVGAGACGGLVARELAAAGMSVVVLEAGKRLDPRTDLRNAEANSAKIQWTEPRVYTGKHSVVPKAGAGVGGGTLTRLGGKPPVHPAHFRTRPPEPAGARPPLTHHPPRPHHTKA